MKELNFKSNDGKKFKLRLPTSSEEIENNEFIEIDGKTLIADEIEHTEHLDLSEEVRDEGELVYAVDEVYDLYYYKGEFYDFYWDTASGCIFSKLKR